MGSTWIIRPVHKPEAVLRLFCFPCAGGSAVSYLSWREILPAKVEVCPVEMPGHGSRLREPLYKHFPYLVNAVAEGLANEFDKPFAFFGHSMGAILAFELARTLRRQFGLVPKQLFVAAHRAPQLPDPDPGTHLLPDKEMEEKLKLLGGTPPEALQEPELLQLVLPIFRADFTALDNYEYVPESPLACPILACGGVADRIASRLQLESWRDQTVSDFSLQIFPGGHFFLFQTAQPLLLGVLSRALGVLLDEL